MSLFRKKLLLDGYEQRRVTSFIYPKHHPQLKGKVCSWPCNIPSRRREKKLPLLNSLFYDTDILYELVQHTKNLKILESLEGPEGYLCPGIYVPVWDIF